MVRHNFSNKKKKKVVVPLRVLEETNYSYEIQIKSERYLNLSRGYYFDIS